MTANGKYDSMVIGSACQGATCPLRDFCGLPHRLSLLRVVCWWSHLPRWRDCFQLLRPNAKAPVLRKFCRCCWNTGKCLRGAKSVAAGAGVLEKRVLEPWWLAGLLMFCAIWIRLVFVDGEGRGCWEWWTGRGDYVKDGSAHDGTNLPRVYVGAFRRRGTLNGRWCNFVKYRRGSMVGRRETFVIFWREY